MENNQTTIQEKPFDDKRTVVEPKLLTIDEWTPMHMSESVSKVQQDIYNSIINRPRCGFTYTAPRNTKSESKDEAPEEWIWVDGYKATKADMTCNEYQYELGKQHDMPEGSVIRDCKSGFHLCRDLNDVFKYYRLNSGNRFFRVHALVRKKDFDEYSTMSKHAWEWRRDKLAAKSIVFVRELTNDEVFKGTDAENWSEEDKNIARAHGIQHVKDLRDTEKLVALGYSEAFAKYIVDEGHFQAAYAAGTQKDLSMDMKVAYIMRNER